MGLYNTTTIVASMLYVFNTAPVEMEELYNNATINTNTSEVSSDSDYDQIYQEALKKIEEAKKRRETASSQQLPPAAPYVPNNPLPTTSITETQSPNNQVNSQGLLADIPQDKIDKFVRISECESSGNWSINTGNGFHGGLQFHPNTWNEFGGSEFAPYAYQATMEQQIYVADKVQKRQGWGAWPACTAKLGIR